MKTVVYNPIETRLRVNKSMNVHTIIVNKQTKKENFDLEEVNFDTMVRAALNYRKH